jgi:spore germination protein GerM
MTRRRSRLLLIALLATLALVAGCGITANDGPEAIAPENLPPDLLNPNPGPSTTVARADGTSTVAVFFVERINDRDRLSEVQREVDDASLPGPRLAALLAQPTEAEAAQGLTTSIPADTVLLDATLDQANDELVLNLSDGLFSIEGEELVKAFAQIVWSVTELESVQRVRFLVDGRAVRAQNAAGEEQEGAVTRADYAALTPRDQPNSTEAVS